MRYPWMIVCGLGGFFALGTLLPQPKDTCPPVENLAPVKAQTPSKVYQVSATIYYPTGDPTFDGTTIPLGKALEEVRWCALSHDLLRKTGWQYGDTLLVYGKYLPASHWGLYILHDKTHQRLRKRVDLLTPTGTYSDRWNGVKIRKFTVKT